MNLELDGLALFVRITELGTLSAVGPASATGQ